MSIALSVRDGVAILTIARPHRRNALDGPSWHRLRDLARELAAGRHGSVRAVIVTGEGGNFSSGMDLSFDNPLIARIAPAIQEGDERAARDLILELKECVDAVADLPVPTFAAIEGACVGGGLEVALACDVRIAAEDASIGLTEVRVGMIPDLGGCARLTRLVGPGRAADLVCTGRKVSGTEAFALGLVERVVPAAEALGAAVKAAGEVAAGGPEAVRLALSVVRMASDLGQTEALAVETRAGALALVSGEPREGIQAFLEKRAPRWE